MAVRRAVIGTNVEIVHGPNLSGSRFGTLWMRGDGLHFRSRAFLLPFAWDIPWGRVAEILVGGEVVRRWGLVPVRSASHAQHVTVVDVDGRQQEFVVPRMPADRIHTLLFGSVELWNHGAGYPKAGS